jgi:hypothetical protein
MAKFRVVYHDSVGEPEDVDADDFVDEAEGEWITFRRIRGMGLADQVLRVRAKDVKRVERVA